MLTKLTNNTTCINLNNIIFLNCIETLKNNDEESLWVSAEDPHLNDKAHLLIANFLYEKLFAEFNSL